MHCIRLRYDDIPLARHFKSRDAISVPSVVQWAEAGTLRASGLTCTTRRRAAAGKGGWMANRI